MASTNRVGQAFLIGLKPLIVVRRHATPEHRSFRSSQHGGIAVRQAEISAQRIQCIRVASRASASAHLQMRYPGVLPFVLLVSIVQVSELPAFCRFPVDVLMLELLIRTKVQGEPLDEGFNFCALFVWGIDATGHFGFHNHSRVLSRIRCWQSDTAAP